MSTNPDLTSKETSDLADNGIPKELELEINSDASIDECLTLARLYLKRAKELNEDRKDLYGAS